MIKFNNMVFSSIKKNQKQLFKIKVSQNTKKKLN